MDDIIRKIIRKAAELDGYRRYVRAILHTAYLPGAVQRQRNIIDPPKYPDAQIPIKDRSTAIKQKYVDMASTYKTPKPTDTMRMQPPKAPKNEFTMQGWIAPNGTFHNVPEWGDHYPTAKKLMDTGRTPYDESNFYNHHIHVCPDGMMSIPTKNLTQSHIDTLSDWTSALHDGKIPLSNYPKSITPYHLDDTKKFLTDNLRRMDGVESLNHQNNGSREPHMPPAACL